MAMENAEDIKVSETEDIADVLENFKNNINELEEKLYVIEKLLEKRYVWNIRFQYLVKWKGYGNEHNTWEPKASLPRKVVNRFEKELQNERRAMRNKLREDGKQGDVKIGCSETDK